MGVDKTVLPTGYRIMVDGAVYGEAWDKTAEEYVSNPSGEDQSHIFEDCEFEIEIAPIFRVLVTDLSYVKPSVTGHT